VESGEWQLCAVECECMRVNMIEWSLFLCAFVFEGNKTGDEEEKEGNLIRIVKWI